jgi:hypothetical protein
MNIPFFNYPKLFSEKASVYKNILENTCERGAYIMQEELSNFEDALATYLGCKHVIGVADGTAALVFSLKASGIQPGDEVIVSTHTFIATAAAVKHIGAIPVVADCLKDSMINFNSAQRLITNKTKGIMPTQLNGRTADMDEAMKLSNEYGLKIVEDSCQALGAKYNNTQAGLFGICGSYSFYPSKTLGCFGDGGAVATNCDDAASFIRQLRDHGRDVSGKVTQWGYNGRLDNIQAAILLEKLSSYKENIERRREIASIYDDRLNQLSELQLPPAPNSDSKRFDIFQNYEIQANNRDHLRAYLSENGIGTIIQWGGWLLHQFDSLNMRTDIDYAHKFVSKYMMLPMNHMLRDDEIHYICDKVINFYTG